MALVLQGGSGPLKDQVFDLTEGLTIGRDGAGIALLDPKVSSIHARITRDEQQNWLLVDNNSKNGLRVDGERVSSVQLKPGVKFLIGDQEFEVVDKSPETSLKPKKRRKHWQEVLAEFLVEHSQRFTDREISFTPLEPAPVLEFVRGLQINTKWVLGYGPRKVGAACLDLPIWEPGAPSVCFELHSSEQGLLFKTAHPGLIKLNDEPVDSQVLRVGDTIKILDTLIEVDFFE